MKVLLVTPYFHPHKGGSQQYAEELYVTLMKQDKSVQVDVLTYNTDNAKKVEKYRGLTIYRIPCFEILRGQFAVPNYIELGRTLTTLFAKNKYDFINAHTRFFESSWYVPFAAKYFKTKSVLTDHCATHPVHEIQLITKISYIVDKLFVPLILPFYSRITATNRATQKFLQSLSKKETTVIYGGVDTQFFKPASKEKTRKVLDIKKSFSQNDVVVSFVGRMIYSKGPQLLLEASKSVLKKHKNVYFIFGGNGQLYPELSKQKNDHIFFTGTLEMKDVQELLSKTDILVHPSLHHEGFPNVLLEAGASGCAVIATDKGGTREIITKDTGIIIKPEVNTIENVLETLIANKSKRKNYGTKLRSWVEKTYDWRKIAKDYKRFITEQL